MMMLTSASTLGNPTAAKPANATKDARRDPRGDRLHPPRWSRVYWHLTCLRQEMERIAANHLAGPSGKNARLLDFGCGNSPYRSILAPHVGEYIGCDLPGNELADCILERPDRLPYADGSAQVVLSSQVLEHTVAPDVYLAECARVLAPGGLLILCTHGVWQYHPDPLDLWRWTSQGLRRIVEEQGFAVADFRGVVGAVGAGLQIIQDAVLHKVWRPFRNGFTHIMQLLMWASDRFCPDAVRNDDAGTYILVARRL